MKKLIFAMSCALLLVSCSKSYMPNSEKCDTKQYNVRDFCDLMAVCYEDGYTVLMDKRTGVLYISFVSYYKFGMMPIMKSDGSCLTLSEWNKEN